MGIQRDRETVSGITASTSQTQGNGALTAQFNVVETVANVNDTVTLPAARAGEPCAILNLGANLLQIFPASGDNLGAGANTARKLEPNQFVDYLALGGSNWYVMSVLSGGSIGGSNVLGITDLAIAGKLDSGIPSSAAGFDVGSGGSYKDSLGVTVVKVFKFDDSADTGEKFAEVTNIDSATTFLAAAGDRLYVGSPFKFWGVRFNPTQALVYATGTERMIAGYWNGSALTACDHMGILKTSANSLGDDILKQTAEKEYIVYDDAIDSAWSTADNVTDKIPNTGTALFWWYLEVPAAGLSTPAIVDEIRVRGSDFDVISGAAFPVFWGKARVKNHYAIPMNEVKSPQATGVVQVVMTSTFSQTSFNFTATGDDVAFIWTLPEGIDTSSPISVEIDYSADAADTYTLLLSGLKLRDNTPISSSVSSDYTSTTGVVCAAAATYYAGQSLTATKMSIQDMVENEKIAFEIERTVDSDNAIYPMVVVIRYVIWANGEHT